MHVDHHASPASWQDTSLWSKLNRLVYIGITVMLMLFLAWVLWNALYAVPAADDFCYGANARSNGIFRNVVSEYFSWGGRFSATFLIGAFAVSQELLLKHYYLVPFLIILVNLLAALWFMKSTGIKSGFTGLFYFAMLIATFRMRESIYWLAGGATYGIACAILLAMIAEHYRLFVKGVVPSATRTVVLSGASFVLAGFNETTMLAHIALLAPMAVFGVTHKQYRSIVWIFLMAIGGAAIAALAPGNFARASTMAYQADVLRAIGTSLAILLKKYTVPLLVSSLLFHIAFALAPARQEPERARRVWWFLLFLFLALWASIFARAYALGELGPERARTIDFMLINSMAFLIARHRLLQRAPSSPGKSKLLTGALSATLVSAACVAAVLPGMTYGKLANNMRATVELHNIMKQRISIISDAQGKIVEVPGFYKNNPPITFFGDIKPDSKQWENVCYAKYFDLTEVRLKNQDQ